MRTRTVLFLGAAMIGSCLAFAGGVKADDAAKPKTTTPATAADTAHAATTAPKPMTMKEVKQKLGIVVFPAKGQTAAKQDSDETDCVLWAADQAGVKPGDKPKDAKAAGDTAAAQMSEAATGAAVKGAAKGAAVGAVIGSISGNAGEGAAYGAAGGAIAGRRAKKGAEQQAGAQAEAKVNAENQAKLDAVKKGMTVCLESKGYTVK
jgi:hypothetical protein